VGWAALALIVLALLWLLASSNFMRTYEPSGESPVKQISNRLFLPGEFLRYTWGNVFGSSNAEASTMQADVPGDVVPQPIAFVPPSQHPFLSSRGSNMHCDAFMSDTYAAAGPVGPELTVTSRTQGFGGYGTVTFDKEGRIVAVYSNGRGFQLELMDPITLEEFASHPLPGRPWYWLLQGILPWKYIGAGMYFFLDHEDRAVVPTTRNTIQVVETPEDASDGFRLVREYDLSDHVVPMRWPHLDSVAWVLPDWGGDYYWYATTGGIVGTVHIETGEVQKVSLDSEIIENSYAVAEDGVYIVSDCALYRFSQDGTGRISIDWRTEYDRGPAAKPGHITRGSGTSVSLMGDERGLVAITDNAEPRVHLLFVRRADGEIVAEEPLFEEGRSGTDISAACFEHADESGAGTGRYTVLVENNWGHHRFPISHPEPGLARVDLIRNEDGSYTAETIWTSPVRGINVFKISLGSGLVYTYWRDESERVGTWYLHAVDFETGEVAFRQKTGTGQGFNNWAGALFLHPDGGVVYTTTIFGLVRMADPGPSPSGE